MDKRIESIKKTRSYLLTLIEDLNTDQLNSIPPGFNNNIIWNLGHLISAQQGLCYLRSGLSIVIEEKFILPFKPETKPEKYLSTEDVAEIKNLLLTSLDEFNTDLQNNLFQSYNSFLTRYGVELNTVEDAIDFLPYHEGLHAGYIMALKRAVLKA